MNKNKPENRRGKILLISATKDFEDLKKRDKLRDSDIKKLFTAYNDFKEIEKYCHIADLTEIQENEFNLSVPRYVDTYEPEKIHDIHQTYNDLKLLEKERSTLENTLKKTLDKLGVSFE